MSDDTKKIGPYYDGLERGKADGLINAITTLAGLVNTQTKDEKVMIIRYGKAVGEFRQSDADYINERIKKFGFEVVKVEEEKE